MGESTFLTFDKENMHSEHALADPEIRDPGVLEENRKDPMVEYRYLYKRKPAIRNVSWKRHFARFRL